MIYLVGGPPRCGKSTVAAALVSRTGCSWVTTDYLASAILPYGLGPDGERRLERLPARDNDERYTRFNVEDIVANYRQRAAYYELGILKGFVEYAASDGRDFVVEGFHLEPRSMVEVRERWPGVARCLLLVRSDVEELTRSLPLGDATTDWAVRFTKDPATFGRIAEMVVRYGEALAVEAAACGCPLLDTSRSLDDSLRRALELLLPTSAEGPSG